MLYDWCSDRPLCVQVQITLSAVACVYWQHPVFLFVGVVGGQLTMQHAIQHSILFEFILSIQLTTGSRDELRSRALRVHEGTNECMFSTGSLVTDDSLPA